ncbi:hypothetical protein ACFO0N_15505 [Halobium salinum]|uniref:Geranylgeranyl pyrophosphate synthase n=1 Tax=Halobium salinum TaxID=1364940 RepID=A0ABD5PF13_9EURY|nr:hypothetical protein [Halobium salinum]
MNDTEATNAGPNPGDPTPPSSPEEGRRPDASIDSLSTIYERDLPDPVAGLVREYDEVVGIRDSFVWKWYYTIAPEYRLSCVAPERERAVRQDKLIAVLFTTLLDDFAEREGHDDTFATAKRIPFAAEQVDPDAVAGDTEHVRFTAAVWDALIDRLADAPRHEEFADVLRFDLGQTVTSMEYAELASAKPALANPTESMRYGAQNMMMFVTLAIDLMNSPGFDTDDLGTLRAVTQEVQKLARIGNWVSTWERELDEGDVAAGVFAHALDRGVVTHEELAALEADTGSAALRAAVRGRIDEAGTETRLLAEWWERYDALRAREFDVESVDLDAYVAGMEPILGYHLASRGHK